MYDPSFKQLECRVYLSIIAEKREDGQEIHETVV